jgi:DNA-binding NarL/FixJ family response regulator
MTKLPPKARITAAPPVPAAPAVPKSSVLLVDDHPVVRDGLAQRIALEPDLDVCATSATVTEALEALKRHRPDLAIVDLTLPDGHGLELLKEIRALYPKVRLLVFSMHDEIIYGERTLLAGAQGYVMKDAPPETLLAAIRSVLAGKIAVSPDLSERMLRSAARSRTPKPPMERLSDRELEVFELIGRGVSTKEIADRLHRSVKTIETHRQRLKTKLQIKGHAELIAQAARWVQETGGGGDPPTAKIRAADSGDGAARQGLG